MTDNAEDWWAAKAEELSEVFQQECIFYCVDGDPRFSNSGQGRVDNPVDRQYG
jgi:hypothetical protein